MKFVLRLSLILVMISICSCGASLNETFTYDERLTRDLVDKQLTEKPVSLKVFRERGAFRSSLLSDRELVESTPDLVITSDPEISKILAIIGRSDPRPKNLTPKREVPFVYHLIFEFEKPKKRNGYIRILDYGSFQFIKLWSGSDHYEFKAGGEELRRLLGNLP